VIFDHAFDVQIFKSNDSEHRNKSVAELMSKITAAIPDALMDTSRNLPFLLPLRSSQSLFICPKESRINNRLARRERSELLNTNVYANHLSVFGKWPRFCLNRKACIPLARSGARDGQCFDVALSRTVKFDFDFADFGKLQLSIFERKAGLRVGEAVVTRMRAKTREAWLLSCFYSTKESLKCFVETAQNILQDLAVNACKFGTHLFDFRQLILLVKVADRLTLKFVGFSSFLKRSIVEFTADIQSLLKPCALSMRREDSVLIRLEHLPFSLCFNVPLDNVQRIQVRWISQTEV